MADISKIVLPDSSSYDLISKRTRGIYRGQIESTSTATAFTVTIDGITEYYDGLTLSIRNPVITSTTNCTLNVNNLGAKRIWASQQNAYVTTSILKGAQFLFTYDGINDRWIKQQGTQTTNSNTIGEYAGSCLAGPFGMARYCLIMKVDDQHWESLVKTSGTSTSKEKNLHGFLLRSPILYQSSSTYTQGKLAGQGSCWSTASFDTRYSTNAGSFSTAGKSFYLVGTIVDEEYFYLSDTWWTNSLPNEEDGKVYIYIGQMYSAYQCTLAPKHPIYIYKNNELIQLIVPSDGSLIKNIPVNSTKKKQGSICSFFDPVGELPLKELTVAIDPVQDLHGYDNPWSAGGGKNKLNYNTVYESCKTGENRFVGYVKSTDGPVFTVPRINIGAFIGQTIMVSAYITVHNLTSVFFRGNINGASTTSGANQITNGNSGYIYIPLTPETANDYVAFSYGSQSGDVPYINFKDVMLEIGSSRSDWTPYSNICPISGWEEMKLTHTGKNIFDQTRMKDQVGWNIIKIYAPVGTVLTMSTNQPTAATSGLMTYFMYADGTQTINENVYVEHPITKIVPDVGYLQVAQRNRDNLTSVADWNYQIEVGSTATAYEPYHGTSITIDFGRTVYGGVLDVLSGVLKINRVMVDLGAFEWSKYTGGTNLPVFYTSTDVSNMKPSAGDNAKCSIYRCQSWTNLNARIDKSVEIHPTIGRPYIADSAYTDAQTFKTAMDGVQLVYELTAPIEITLDPHKLESLYGSNTIYADTGNISIEYITNNGVIIPDASLTRPGLMTISDKEKINQINDIYEEIDNTKNHIIFSKTQPVNQQAGDIWVIIK